MPKRDAEHVPTPSLDFPRTCHRFLRELEANNSQHGALLLHRGLIATQETKLKLRLCVDTWRRLAPLNRWLEQLE